MQRFNSQLLSFTPATAAIAALASLAAAAQAAPPAASVTGGGQAALIDDGTESPLQFQIAAMVFDDESAVGHAIFVLRKPFARDWGAVPGVVDLILLKAEIHAGSVAEDGTITLNGEFTEVDISFTEGVVFVEKDTELTSLFEIVLGGDLGPGEFTLQWCLLPAFEIEVTKGRLRVE
jgi:hypothetical protein